MNNLRPGTKIRFVKQPPHIQKHVIGREYIVQRSEVDRCVMENGAYWMITTLKRYAVVVSSLFRKETR